MNEAFLQELGLTKSQSMAYAALIKNSPCSPPALAKIIDESRTNTYKILETLEQLGLVMRDESHKKIRYIANSPTALSALAHLKKQQAEAIEKKLQASLPEMIDQYFEHSLLPSVRYFQGKEGLVKIYEDQLSTNTEIVYLRAKSDLHGLDDNILHLIRNKFPAKGIHRRAITQDYQLPQLLPHERMNINQSDKHMMLERTWIDSKDYTAPVEWAAYGDKLSIISFGKEAVGMIIESPQIAEGFKQIFELLNMGIRLGPNYHLMPKNVKYTAIPEALRK